MEWTGLAVSLLAGIVTFWWPFAIAAERTGRRCCGIELDPVYVDTIVRRWQALTGGNA